MIRLALLVGSLSLFAGTQANPKKDQGKGPEVGKDAPDVTLKTQDGKKEVQLSKLKGKPVVLIFGSYT